VTASAGRIAGKPWLSPGHPWGIPAPRKAPTRWFRRIGRYHRQRLDEPSAAPGSPRSAWCRGLRHTVSRLARKPGHTLRLWTAQPIDPNPARTPSMPAITFGALRWRGNKGRSRLTPVSYTRRMKLRQVKNCALRQKYFFPQLACRTFLRPPSATSRRFDVRCPTRRPYRLKRSPIRAVFQWRKMMRPLDRRHHMDFDPAWKITRRPSATPIHTLLPEALESWLCVFSNGCCRRHMQTVYHHAKNLRRARQRTAL